MLRSVIQECVARSASAMQTSSAADARFSALADERRERTTVVTDPGYTRLNALGMYDTAPSEPDQKRLSAAMLLASNTTTRRLTFMLRLPARRRCTVLQPLEEVEHHSAPAAGDGPDGRATCGR